MAQTAMMMKLTPNICLYDPFAPALEGVAEELYHCGFEGVNLTYTSDIKEALTGASYIVSSGGAARKAGMTREDLLKGNAEIAAQFGKDVRQYLSLIHISKNNSSYRKGGTERRNLNQAADFGYYRRSVQRSRTSCEERGSYRQSKSNP